MKKLFLFATAVMMLAACSTDTTQDVAPSVVPGTIAVSFDDETRVQLDKDLKTVWTAGDKVSVFYKSDANECWTFQGDTGDRNGNLRREEQGSATVATDKVVIVYPYSESYELDAQTGSVSLIVPSMQHYTADSYGAGSNIMVSSGTSDSFKLKSVCGWLKLSITGSKTVSKIVLKSNNGEQLAGRAKIDYENLALSLIGDKPVLDDTQVGGTLTFDDEYATALTLDCGSGVILSGIPKAFYISLAPRTIETGITVKVHYTDGTVYEKSTANSIVVERNHIVPMTEIDADAISESEENYVSIRYVASDKNIIDNSSKNSGWWASVVSNTYDVENNVGTLVLPKGSSIGNFAFQSVTELLSIEIPDGVTSIEKYAFGDCSNLTSINIPESVTSIGEWAFASCRSLTSITIPDSVTSIGHTAFATCSSLTSIIIPDSVTSIEDHAFGSCSSLTSITIPDSVTSIGDDAFHDCSSLTSITIPDSVTSIGDSAFYRCSSLTSITIGNSVTTIYRDAFVGCNNLQGVYITDIAKWCAINFNGQDANPLYYAHNLYLNGVPVTDLAIPDGVTSIKSYAFWDCSGLTSVTIPDSVTSIGQSAFSYCSGLTSVTIPDSVTSIGQSAFSYCSSLTSIDIPDSVTSIKDSTFSGCSSLTSINISKYVASIGSSAFQNCSSLTSIDIPDGVTSIKNSTFSGCSSLKSINIPNSVTSIGSGAFEGCHSLADIKIPECVTSIEDEAFSGCSSLTSINIPKLVSRIGGIAFENCLNLSSVHITDIAKWCAINFSMDRYSNSRSSNPLYYAQDLYLNGELVTDLVIPDGVASIADRAFADYGNLTDVTVPDSVTSIGDYAFYRCGNLASVTIGKGIAKIDDRAFYNCSSLTTIYCKPETPPALQIVDNFDPFFGISDSVKIYVPAASVEAYKSTATWSEYADKIVGYDFNR